jgi:iron(III) transport system substrate-binding protein
MWRCFAVISIATAGLSTGLACAEELNLYSARHYQTDEALYSGFTRATGIRINRVDADDAGILARLRSEGSSSPADVILLVDAARLWRAEVDGLFQPLRSPTLDARIPVHLRGKDSGEGALWFGLSTRARIVVFNKKMVLPTDVDSYEKLADAKNKGRLCTRSGSHPYNLSLFGAMLEHLGPARTEAWLNGLVANMARPPKGGDTDQLMAVASGECQIALSNSYYLARLMRSTRAVDRAAVESIGVVFPNQASWGTHVNVAGAAVAKFAPHRTAAVKFIEYLASDLAQLYFADGNNEWPVVNIETSNPALRALGAFKADPIPVSIIGMNQVIIQNMLDRAGYK